MNRTRKILLVFFVVLTVFLFQRYFLEPAGLTLREKLETELAALGKFERVLSRPVSSEDVQRVGSQLDEIEKRLVKEKTDFLASSQVQSRVTGIAGASGMTLSTLRPVDPVQDGSYRTVAVYFEGAGSIKQLSDFLRRLDEDEVLLKVDKITMSVTNLQNPKEIRVKMQVSSLRRS